MSKKIETMLEEIRSMNNEHGIHEKYVTIEDVADYLSMTKWAIYKRVSKKQIPCKKIGGKLRFKLSLVDKS